MLLARVLQMAMSKASIQFSCSPLYRKCPPHRYTGGVSKRPACRQLPGMGAFKQGRHAGKSAMRV